jgi:hypothetical protein
MSINVIRAFLKDAYDENRYAFILLGIDNRSRLYIVAKSNGISFSLEGFHLSSYPSATDTYNAPPVIVGTRELGWATSNEDMEAAISLFHEIVVKFALDTDLTIAAVINDSEKANVRAMLTGMGDISLEIMGELLE